MTDEAVQEAVLPIRSQDGKEKKRWRDLTGPYQQLERHAESKMRGQEHWKGGDREMKRERKKAPSKKSGWSITHIHPSLSRFFCQFFKGPKKTSWLNAQNLQEGMSRGYNLHAALYCQYKFKLWFIFIWFSSGFWMLCEYSKLWQILKRLPARSTLWIRSSGIYCAAPWGHCVHCSFEKLLKLTPTDRQYIFSMTTAANISHYYIW